MDRLQPAGHHGQLRLYNFHFIGSPGAWLGSFQPGQCAFQTVYPPVYTTDPGPLFDCRPLSWTEKWAKGDPGHHSRQKGHVLGDAFPVCSCAIVHQYSFKNLFIKI